MPRAPRKEASARALGLGLAAGGAGFAAPDPAASSRVETQRFIRHLLQNPDKASEFLVSPEEVAAEFGVTLSSRFPKYGFVFLTHGDCHGLRPRNDMVGVVIARYALTRRAFYFSLNPLIISRKVMESKDLLVESFSGMKADTEATIDYITVSGFDLEVLLLPFCILERKHTTLLPPAGEVLPQHYYFDPQHSDECLEHAIPLQLCSDKCRPCAYSGICRGFYREYLEIFGTDEIRPYAS